MLNEGRGCLVADKGCSDKVAQLKIEGQGSGTAVPSLDSSQRGWKENGISSFINLYFVF